MNNEQLTKSIDSQALVLLDIQQRSNHRDSNYAAKRKKQIYDARDNIDERQNRYS